MIDLQQAVATLRVHYPDLEAVSDRVYRGMDRHAGQPYAVRYFDLRDDVPTSLESLQKYQEEVLSEAYYAADAKADLRWNHYLYFVANADKFGNDAFLKAKSVVEADREYARKIVVEESLLEAVVARTVFTPTGKRALPPDALSVWVAALDRHSLGFVVDDSLKVPDVVQHIVAGNRQGRQRPPSAPALAAEEEAAATDFLARVEIQGFRPFPKQRTFDLGLVNLISGVNGVGKTSTLEAIEFLFCGKTKRTDKPVLQNTTIAGLWATSGLTLKTGHRTPGAQFRARQLAWYGRTELRKLTLDDSFGKFNFLDTDAAVRLTVESSLERLTEDVFQLLLGAESSKALDRLDRVSTLRAEMSAREETIKAQAPLGWTIDRVRSLAEAVGVSDQVTEVELGNVAEEVMKERDALTGRVSELERDARAKEARIGEISATHSFPPGMSLAAMQKETGERVRTAEQVVTAASEIDALLDFRSASSVDGLRAGLEQAHDFVAKLRTAIQREAENDQALTRETTLAGDAAKEIEAYRVRLKRVESARQVIDDLIKGQSGRLLAEQVLRENASSIGTTFEKIHSPNEFDVQIDDAADDTLRIVRRSTGRKVELDEMSSGQRAAYALSLFLAMNERLRTGPRVLIFDDPVSHVDDINTLSFLDHLRDIALTRMRQIFFRSSPI